MSEQRPEMSRSDATLLEDTYLLERLAQFNRERVPERVVHAKGGGAYGVFEVTEDVTQWCKADFLSPGRRTPVFARFSTVAGEHGSADTVRDPRGFALKFYTDQGNYDLVGSNTPVFFVRDVMKFSSFIHSQKRMADTGLRSNDAQWDFWTLSPESTHQVAILMTDRGTPRSWRTMNGYGSHTYMWVNAGGERFWIKYHFKTGQGIDNLTADEADALAAEDPDHHRRDLFRAIGRGAAPEWRLEVQVMPFEAAADYRFNPFDVTKVWPHGDYPPIPVGRLVLDRNPVNHFAEVEQAAFAPANMVPGIGPSPDRLLLGRLSSYPDAHRYRIGMNYAQLPVNMPPNGHGDERHGEPGLDAAAAEIGRCAYEAHAAGDDSVQARNLLTVVLGATERSHVVANVVRHLKRDVSVAVRDRAIRYWGNVDHELAGRIALGLGLEPLAPASSDTARAVVPSAEVHPEA